MKTPKHPFLRASTIPSLATVALTASVQAELLSFDGNVASGVTTHTIAATDWADYVGGSPTFNSANQWGRLYWRGSAGDGQYIHFDLSSLTGLTLVSPATVTLQNANPTWGGGVDGSYVATANSAWTAAGGAAIPGATAITNALNATGSYGFGAAVSWGIGSTTFQDIVNNQGSFNGLAVIGGSGSQLHFTGPTNPFLTVQSGSLTSTTGIITADTGSTTWNASNYAFVGSNDYSPALNTLTISGELAAGTSGAGVVTIHNGGTVAVNQAGNANYYWALDGTTIHTGGRLTISGHSNIHNLTLAGGELASSATDPTYGSWGIQDATTVTGGVTSTISAQQITLSGGVFNVDPGATLNFTGSTRNTGDALTKNGEGAMRIAAYQSYTGGTTVNAGSLELAGATGGWGLLRGVLTVNSGATVTLTGGDGTGFGWNNPISNLSINGGTVSSAGAMHLFNISGGITMTGGTLQSNNGTSDANGPQMEWLNATVNTNASADTATIGGRIRMRGDGGAAGVTFNVADGDAATDLLVTAAVTEASGGRSITKTGAGTMALSGVNTYTGTTTVSEGTLSIASAYLNDLAAVTIGLDGKMDLNFEGSDTVGSLEIDGSGPLPAGVYNSSHPTYGSHFTGTGSLVVAGANGSWISLVDGTWSDSANWASGTIAVGYDATATFNAATGVNVTVDSNRKIGNLAFSTSGYALNGAGVLLLDAGTTPAVSVTSGNTATISANINGTLGLEKTGAGSLVFTGVKSYSGGTTVSAGTLELFGGNSGNSQISGALTIAPGATTIIAGGDGSGFGWNAPVTAITVDGGTLNAASGSHLGFGAFANLTLDNGATVLGNWQWNGDGFLNFASLGDSTNTIGAGSVTLRADAGANHSFAVSDGAAATDLQVNANLTDQWPAVWWVPASGLTKSGEGTMVLNGTNTYDGNTVVSAGTLEVTASSTLRFRPTTNGATNKVSGSGTGVLSFLGTVDLDLAAANVTPGNVWNLFDLASFASAPSLSGTAGVTSTLGAFTEASAGTWELPVTGAKWVFTEANGNLAYMVTATDYDNWEVANGVTGGENDDDDADGLTNSEEYAFGTDPTGGSSANPIVAPLDKATGTFSYTRRATPASTGLSYSVWTSTDLGSWTEDTGATEGTPSVSGEVETVPVTISPALLSNSKLFIQVRVD